MVQYGSRCGWQLCHAQLAKATLPVCRPGGSARPHQRLASHSTPRLYSAT